MDSTEGFNEVFLVIVVHSEPGDSRQVVFLRGVLSQIRIPTNAEICASHFELE